jgi:hypothetical protein
MPGEGHHVRLVDRHHCTLDLVCQSTEIAPPFRVVGQLAAHFRQKLAVVAHLDFCEPLGVLCDQFG